MINTMTTVADAAVTMKTKLTRRQRKLVGSIFWRSMWLMFCTS